MKSFCLSLWVFSCLLGSLSLSSAADDLLITEVMAANNGPLLDEEGNTSDWIEIHNAGTNTVNLNGWFLTDDAQDLTKWRFPSTNLPPNGYWIIFASENDRRVPGAPLHTNFKLDDAGEYLALVRPDGTNIASAYNPSFSVQVPGVSFGLAVQQTTTTLVASGAVARVLVPTNGALGVAWTQRGFDDAGWLNGPTGVGFDRDGQVPFVSVTLADSVAEFSGTQGQANWFYGYWDKRADADGFYATNEFVAFPNAGGAFGANNFWTGTAWDWFSGNPPYTELTSQGGRPTAGNGNAALPDQWAVRRYVSEYNGPLALTGKLTHTSDWVYVTDTGVAANSALYIYLTGLGEGYLDDVKLVAGAVPEAGANLLVNGDFESGAITPWVAAANLVGSTVTTAVRHGGARSLRLVSTAAGSSRDSAVVQDVVPALTAGQTYTLSYWYLPGTNSAPLTTRFSGGWINTSPVYCGDGTVGRIFVDGAQVFEQTVLVGSVDYNVSVQTRVGSKVDFVIDAGGTFNNACEGTIFTAKVDTADPTFGVVADSVADWSVSGQQGEKNWFYGYVNGVPSGAPLVYNAANFIPFPRDGGPQSTNNFWDGERWEWFNGTPPADRIEQYWMTPRGTNNGAQHWAIKRWVSEVSGSLTIDWSALKEEPDQYNRGGGGVVVRVFHKGVQVDSAVIRSNNVVGVSRRLTLNNLQVGDPVDFAVDPRNEDGRIDDDSDRTLFTVVMSGSTSLNSQITSDVQTAMVDRNATAYLRIPFQVTDPTAFNSLRLRVKYDDGFVAYLNGSEVAMANVPTFLDWSSAASANRTDADANSYVEFDVSQGLEALVPGENVLAIHGLNSDASDSDFLILPELTATTSTLLAVAPRYFALPTPGAANGTGNTNLGPLIRSAEHTPNVPQDNEVLWVTASVAPTFQAVGDVRLLYRVHYGSEVNTAMFDDGQHADGLAGDGVWGASIPAAASVPGQMVRYYIFATDAQGRSSRFPAYQDPQNSPEYQGTVVFNPALTNGLPVLNFFVQNQVAATNFTGTRGSLFWDGEFFDNVKVSGHGQTTWRVFPKRGMNFNLNTGYKLQWKRGEDRVKAFDLLTSSADKAYMRMTLAFEAYRDAGVPTHFAFPVRLQQNNAFHSIMTFVEQANDDLLQRNGLDPEGAFYKIYFPLTDNAYTGAKKITRKTEPNDDLQNLIDGLGQAGPPRRNYLFDHVDIAEVVNWMATLEFVQNEDCCSKNYYVYRDTRGSGEWQMLPWDHDLTFGRTFVNWVQCGVNLCGGYYDTNLYATNLYSTEARASLNFISAGGVTPMVDAILAYADTQEMFYRRWSSIQEQLLQPPGTHPLGLRMERRIDDITAQMTADAALDFSKWLPLNPPSFATNETFAQGVARLKNQYLGPRRNWIFNQLTFASGGPYLGLQPTNAVIRIARVEANPSGNQAQEYILFTNANTYAVDMSRWQLTGGVTHVFKPGTVLPARGSLYLSPDVKAFRARPTGPGGGQGLFAQGNYRGQLSAWGESLSLVDTTGRLVNRTNYPGNPSLPQQYLRITEIMYHPATTPGLSTNADEFEYIELKNIGPATLNLLGVRFLNGVEFNFTGSSVTSLASGATTLVVRNLAAFTSRYGDGFNIAGEFSGQLDNGGENLLLVDATGEKILDFNYDNAWYPITEGFGFSLEIVNELAAWETWDLATSWRPSGSVGGSPGLMNPAAASIAAIRINEVLTHTDAPILDAIELHNPTGGTVPIGGWFVTDDFNTPKKYRINDSVALTAGAYLVLDETHFNPTNPPSPTGFSFSSLGDEAYLFSATLDGDLTGYFHGFAYGAAENGVSFGRHTNSVGAEHFVAQTATTLGATNAGPKVGPLVLSELAYRPPDLAFGEDNSADEFIEVLNVTGASVALSEPSAPNNTWHLRGSVDFDFPPGVVLAAGAHLLVVNFNPTNLVRLAAFRARYVVPAPVLIFGPYAGKLDNSAGSVRLLKPDMPVLGTTPFILVDAVDYTDQAPWPVLADGTGATLQRRFVTQYGNDPANWLAAAPTAGRPLGNGSPPSITVSPSNQVAVVSGESQLQVTAIGSAPLRYQWRFNGATLPDATNASLLLTNVQTAQAGAYAVTVFNNAGSVESTNANLSVVLGAYFIVQPQSTNARPGVNVALSALAVSSSPISYQWRLNGTNLIGATATNYTVTNVQSAKSGVYSVVATDSIGPVSSRNATLTVVIDPVIVQSPVSQTAIPGQPVILSVVVSNTATLPLGYRWRRGSVYLTDSYFTLNDYTSYFVLTNFQPTFTNYSVVVTNISRPSGVVSTVAILTPLLDGDSDGLPDTWETRYDLNLADASDRDLDTDNDGRSNWQEYISDTDPRDPASYFKIDALNLGDGAALSFAAKSNKTYSVFYTEALDEPAAATVWTKLLDVPARAASRTETVMDPGFSPTRFYRLATPRQP